jgi:hypothetical protein
MSLVARNHETSYAPRLSQLKRTRVSWSRTSVLVVEVYDSLSMLPREEAGHQVVHVVGRLSKNGDADS